MLSKIVWNRNFSVNRVIFDAFDFPKLLFLIKEVKSKSFFTFLWNYEKMEWNKIFPSAQVPKKLTNTHNFGMLSFLPNSSGMLCFHLHKSGNIESVAKDFIGFPLIFCFEQKWLCFQIPLILYNFGTFLEFEMATQTKLKWDGNDDVMTTRH